MRITQIVKPQMPPKLIQIMIDHFPMPLPHLGDIRLLQ